MKIRNGIIELRYCGDQLTGRDLLVSGNYVVLTFHTENKTGKLKSLFSFLFCCLGINKFS